MSQLLFQVNEKLGKDKVLWFNLRCEPVAYLEGLPVALRDKDALHTNIQVPMAQAEGMEDRLLKEISSRTKDGRWARHLSLISAAAWRCTRTRAWRRTPWTGSMKSSPAR